MNTTVSAVSARKREQERKTDAMQQDFELMSKFLQIHFLTSYPATLLNRDDAGFAKRLPFGGAERIRISSQCLKRHWRTFDGKDGLGTIEVDGATADMSIRSRYTFHKYLFQPLVEAGVSEDLARSMVATIMEKVLGESPKATKSKKKKAEEGAEKESLVKTNQITVLGHPEMRYLLKVAKEICAENSDVASAKKAMDARLKKDKKNIKTMKQAAGLDAALFGRMVTKDMLARGDAAVHVAHAFTVHRENAEPDYFSAMDDLLGAVGEEELGAGHINTTELTSGLFYGYVAIDLPLLISNLEGCKREEWKTADRRLAMEVVRRLVSIVATVSPGAKLGSTAPYAYAQFLMVESGDAQPRTLANAFLRPVPQERDLLGKTYEALAGYVADLDEAYGSEVERRYLALGPKEILEEVIPSEMRMNLKELANWTAARVKGEA